MIGLVVLRDRSRRKTPQLFPSVRKVVSTVAVYAVIPISRVWVKFMIYNVEKRGITLLNIVIFIPFLV